MANPTFTKSGVSVSPLVLSRDALMPFVRPRVLNQFVGVSDANTVKVASVGAPLETIVIQFAQLTRTDRDNIIAFLADPLVNYGENSFTYTDSDGVSSTVRFLDTELALPEDSDNNVSWELVLTKV